MWGSTTPCGNNQLSSYDYASSSNVQNNSNRIGTLYLNTDIARKIMGGNWRMPNADEISELLLKTTYSISDEENIIYCHNPNTGKYIIFPRGGYYDFKNSNAFYPGAYYYSRQCEYTYYNNRYYEMPIYLRLQRTYITKTTTSTGYSYNYYSTNIGTSSPNAIQYLTNYMLVRAVLPK